MKISLPATLLLLTASSFAAVVDPPDGLAIAREADRRDTGWGDYEARMEMILRDKHGQESARRMRLRFMETASDGDKSLGIFDEPPDVKGTALLTFSHRTATDDQWLYLPALKRVKRIASADKSGAFLGSEYAFEDISSEELEKYSYKRLEDETLDGVDCFVVERTPLSKYSGYSRQKAWFDKEEYRLRKIEYYDRKASLLKTLSASKFEKHAGRFWRATESTMLNHQTGKSTVLRWSAFRFGTGLRDADFTQERLKRSR